MPLDLSTLTVDEWASMTLSQWDTLALDPVTAVAFIVAATSVWPAGAVALGVLAAGAVAQETRS